MAKGVSKANTFRRIYLKEYENTRLRRETVNVDFIKPSTENMFNVLLLIPIVELILFIRDAKQISELNISSPKLLIDKVKFEATSNISPMIK